MDSGTGLSASDVALLDGNNGIGGGNSFVWIFGLLILMGMFNGGFGGGFGNRGFNNAIGYENLATSNEVQRGFDNQNSMANQREILSAVSSGTAQAVAATNNAAFQNINVVKDAQMQLQERLADIHTNQQAIIANQNQCCCDTKMLIQSTSANTDSMIQQNRYEAALNTAAINDRTTEMGQKILDAIQTNRMADMQNEINQLQLANQMANVVRFPNAYTYNGGVFPPFTGNCNCGV